MSKYKHRIEFKNEKVSDIITNEEILYGNNGISVYLSKTKNVFIPYSSIEVIETDLQS